MTTTHDQHSWARPTPAPPAFLYWVSVGNESSQLREYDNPHVFDQVQEFGAEYGMRNVRFEVLA